MIPCIIMFDWWQLFVEMSMFTVWFRPVSEIWPVWVVPFMVSWENPRFLSLTNFHPTRHSHHSIHFCVYFLRTLWVLQCPFDLLTICLTSFISWELSLLIWLFIFSFRCWVEFILRSTIKDRKKQTKPPHIKNIWSPMNLWTKKYLTYVSLPC